MNANQLIEKGIELAESLQLPAAEQKFSEALKMERSSVPAMIWLGRLALMRKDSETAKRFLDQALSYDSRQAEAIALQGLRELQNGNLETAREWMREALEQEPNLEMVYGNLACCCRLLGRTEEAEAAAKMGIALNRESATSHYELARILADQNKPDEAFLHFVEALRSNPFFLKAYVALGTTFSLAGKTEMAIELYRKGLGLMPDAHALRDQLCGLLFSRGQIQEAIGETIKSIEMRNEESDYVRLGVYTKVAAELEKRALQR